LEPAPAITGTRPLGRGDAQLDDAAVLLVAEGGGLAGGADRHQAVDAARDGALDQGDERRLIHLPVAERGDQRRHDALEMT
jgi:hypothetical protein